MSKEKKELIFISIFTTLGTFVILCLLAAYTPSLSFQKIYTILLTYLYDPGYNNVYTGTVFRRPLLLYFYLGLMLATLLALTIHHYKSKTRNNSSRHKEKKNIIICTFFTFYTVVYLLQLSSMFNHHNKKYQTTLIKPQQHRYENSNIPIILDFAQKTKLLAPGPRNAKFITDWDLNKSPFMFYHRVLAYFLYPIDIRNVRKEPIDTIVVFNKKNPLEVVPDNFEVLKVLGKKGLIAVKKDLDK